ncbi:MAG: DUF2071 domain-containing protein [Actinobacteria bacterium]|nr:MAG: DUF2071 domain-containing protein [Actinomycetota bacterium]
MAQTWDDLLFAHWRVDADEVRGHVPDGLELQERDGSAWLGVTPFVLTDLRARGTFPLPVVSSFRELNVRTYVTDGRKPGIWFFSLDASSKLAVAAARRLYKLPYFLAEISVERHRGRLLYECVRDERKAFSGAYNPAGDVFEAPPDSLEHFLTERYCLYAAEGGTLYRAEIHHRPWPLQTAEATIDLNTMPPDDIRLDGEPLLHYSAREDVLIWPLERVR